MIDPTGQKNKTQALVTVGRANGKIYEIPIGG
ncbi:uncharacterized protein METZ01_LOCUS460590, partial [marine metagenome]